MTDERVISDLSICQPSSALSRQWQDGKWMLMNYETDDGIVGQMLYYTFYPVFHAAMRRPRDQEFVNAPTITLPLEASGWYEVYLGMHYASAARLEGPQIQVKLSSLLRPDFTMATTSSSPTCSISDSFPCPTVRPRGTRFNSPARTPSD